MENAIERIVVTNSEDTVDDQFLTKGSEQGMNVNINIGGIIPLKTAKQIVEKMMVSRAYKLYGSTYKAAKALKVDQSTVAKLIKKHNITKI